MSLNKRARKSLILTLGLAICGTSAITIHAQQKIEGTTVAVERRATEKETKEVVVEKTNREIVTANKLNVRKGPSTEEDVITTLTKGTVVEIVERENGWNKIKLSDEEEGWVSGDYTQIETGIVTANKLNVRKGPSTEDEKIGELEYKTDVEILEENENWFKVEIDDNTTGWVSGDYVFTDSEAIKEEARKAEEAKKQQVAVQNNETVVGSASQNASTGRLMTVVATAYTGDTITSTGTTPKWGTIAVDPTVIPYGTKVYIPQFDKVFIAEDCGGAIKGNKIDIFMNDSDSVNNWGRRTIDIQILG